MLKLYSYFRSSASFRVRIALHWKELKFDYAPVHLLRDGGQQHSAEFRNVNPLGLLPALDHDGFLVADSLAIIDYLDGISPYRRLLPTVPRDRATVLQLCEAVNSGMQPLQNLRTTQALKRDFAFSDSDVKRWTGKWLGEGFDSYEKLLRRTAGTYCLGGEITAADLFLVPQCFAARRMGLLVENYPLVARIEQNCLALSAFQLAHPSVQPDSE